MPRLAGTREVVLESGGVRLDGTLSVPEGASGIVVFAHGSGSSRFSPRNRAVAEWLNACGLGTLLFDLLTEHEEQLDAVSRRFRFDVELLARRLVLGTDWLLEHERTAARRIGFFGSSTGAAAALIGAAQRPGVVAAVVSRGGRPDLAGDALGLVQAPTLLIVGGNDEEVLDANRDAAERMSAPVRLEVISGATHLFEEPGALERVSELAGDWFTRAFVTEDRSGRFERSFDRERRVFADRRHAGRQLALQLSELFDREQLANVVLVALPRGGVPVAHEVSTLLDVPLEVLFVRKLGAPLQPEYAIGAICEDGTAFVDSEAARLTGADDDAVRSIIDRELARMADYRQRFSVERRELEVRDRDVVLIDDGLATGMTALAAARDLRKRAARTITFAAPVCAPQSLQSMRDEFDRAVCLQLPDDLGAIGFWYRDFDPPSDDEIASMLSRESGQRSDGRGS